MANYLLAQTEKKLQSSLHCLALPSLPSPPFLKQYLVPGPSSSKMCSCTTLGVTNSTIWQKLCKLHFFSTYSVLLQVLKKKLIRWLCISFNSLNAVFSSSYDFYLENIIATRQETNGQLLSASTQVVYPMIVWQI